MTNISSDISADFPLLPPFPNDVPTAPLLRISLQKLIEGDILESQSLWDACTNAGFFYLDVRDATAERIDGNIYLKDTEDLFGVEEDVFALPQEEKEKYDLSGRNLYFGYKGKGKVYIDKHGTRDRNEQYYISKDDILEQADPLPTPEVLKRHYDPLLKRFTHNSHAISQIILAQLATHLHLPAAALTSLHRLASISGDQVRFVRSAVLPTSPAEKHTQAALGAHTDFGSVTLLFNRLGGLQIPTPGVPHADLYNPALDGAAWRYVRPLPGHCVVNLGDALVKLTKGVLKSSVHRVVDPPGVQAVAADGTPAVRYSLVYFVRPEDAVMLTPLEGSDVVDAVEGWADDEVISSGEWTIRRALGRRKMDTWAQSQGTEHLSAKKAEEPAPQRTVQAS